MELIQTSSAEIISKLENRMGAILVDSEYSRTALAQICRYTASILCPVSKRSLTRMILEPLQSLGYSNLIIPIGEVLDTLISQGELLELEDINDETSSKQTLLYAAPPQFVSLSSNYIILLGISPDNTILLPVELENRIVHNDCLRFLTPLGDENLKQELLDIGLYEVGAEVWLKTPMEITASNYLDQFDQALMKKSDAGEISELSILDSSSPPTYYNGRWRSPKEDTGHFIAKRSGAYGEQIWCYVDLDKGSARRLLDLPDGHTLERGCDQAWRLQAAIDNLNGTPQKIRIRPVQSDKVALDMFSPIPKWLERRWSSMGTRSKSAGCLASYLLPSLDIEKEIAFAKGHMWLESYQE